MSALTTPPRSANLIFARPEITALLKIQLAEGQRLLELPLADRFALARATQEKAGWSLRNRQLLFRVFEDNSGIDSYHGMTPLSSRASVPLQIEHFRQEVWAQIGCIQNVLGQGG